MCSVADWVMEWQRETSLCLIPAKGIEPKGGEVATQNRHKWSIQ